MHYMMLRVQTVLSMTPEELISNHAIASDASNRVVISPRQYDEIPDQVATAADIAEYDRAYAQVANRHYASTFDALSAQPAHPSDYRELSRKQQRDSVQRLIDGEKRKLLQHEKEQQRQLREQAKLTERQQQQLKKKRKKKQAAPAKVAPPPTPKKADAPFLKGFTNKQYKQRRMISSSASSASSTPSSKTKKARTESPSAEESDVSLVQLSEQTLLEASEGLQARSTRARTSKQQQTSAGAVTLSSVPVPEAPARAAHTSSSGAFAAQSLQDVQSFTLFEQEDGDEDEMESGDDDDDDDKDNDDEEEEDDNESRDSEDDEPLAASTGAGPRPAAGGASSSSSSIEREVLRISGEYEGLLHSFQTDMHGTTTNSSGSSSSGNSSCATAGIKRSAEDDAMLFALSDDEQEEDDGAGEDEYGDNEDFD
jgi:hypothetical protein